MLKTIKIIFTGLVAVALGVSCSKEKSFEIIDNEPSMGDNCKITTVVPSDSTTGKGLGSYNIILGTNKLTTGLQLYDSITQTLHFSTQFTYVADTIRIGTGDYFIKDANGRVKEFYTHAVPGDLTSEAYIYKYYYDQAGFLATKNWYVVSTSTTIPVFAYTYTWQNGNLIKVTATEATGDKRTALTAELTYNTSLKPKNFMYVFPEADELAAYVFSVDLGNRATNIPTHVTVKVYDETGAVTDTYNTQYSSHKLSPEGYVLEFYASGDNVDGLLLISEGLIKFKYTCD